VQAVAARANQRFKQIRDAQAIAFAPPPVLELGNASGFDLELLDRANQGHENLMQARDQLLALVHKDARLEQVRANGLDDEPQYQFNVDWEKASALGLTITDINNTLSAAWGRNSLTTSSTGVASSACSSRAMRHRACCRRI